jgi:hypothetical protein
MLQNAIRAAVLGVSLLIPAQGTAYAHQNDPIFLQFEFGEYRYPEPAWAAGGISCKGGWRIVDKRGFHDVAPIECHGRTFTYSAWWRDEVFRVYVDSASGRILGVGPS